jgi:hypothetical protein
MHNNQTAIPASDARIVLSWAIPRVSSHKISNYPLICNVAYMS